jgi:hypothetical protein
MTVIDQQLQALAQFMSIESLHGRLATASEWIGHKIEKVIPSTIIGVDGISLSSLLCFAGDFITEIDLQSRFDNFDFMRLTVVHMRVTLGIHEIKDGDTLVASYHTASVLLSHSPNLSTRLTYAGLEDPKNWLNEVKDAFPAEGFSVI